MLLPVDSVKDRFASYYHWNDEQALDQAVSICLENKIDLNEVERWSLTEQQESKFQVFKKLLKKIKKN